MIDLVAFEVDVDGKYRIPATVAVNHLLMVGLSISGKYNEFQELVNAKDTEEMNPNCKD